MRALLYATLIALVCSLAGTPVAIRYFTRRGWGQEIRDELPEMHQVKRGTPTMGGTVIVLSTLVAYFVTKLATMKAPTSSGLLVLFLMAGLGAVGFMDDFIKIVRQRSLGLRARAKLAGQLAVTLTFAVLVLHFRNTAGLTPASENISFLRDIGWLSLGPALFLLWSYVMIAGWSNAVNLTDGQDGLAAGTSVMAFGAYVVIGLWQYGQNCAVSPSQGCYQVRDPLDLAIVAAAVMGACFGFLWWNAAPAQIYMGDTGSLALGGAFAGLAICSRTELLAVLIGGLFLMELLSVVIQVTSFKLRHKRVFLNSPIHHHFEQKEWKEVTITIRFWIIAGLCVALGLGVFYGGFKASA
ncbi:phospho-N-acetylmuramoyl-pentapeptide-transferase [Catenulispora acidiphila DSM 44928]|uniref:Phospho-N-acetylmuramoyl-pentapeptide-transferase n=1 Tax=Catenulispora acidiphila (strain DSM 44928 / JCM 14897 / NBRC 102108 / NRRL B-24433 / ID139908) TaxID=479433 RepID=C7Q8N2_CATAD|nr:phospho-N-acetylmuramoyl-pentapeptide-transferase [Catenulispora acidiphila]ACU70297.1 phospho-N-acetylmuramoyl-pentapeptide-transferase [Catenulispora acidiphila DSM 44928]